MAYAVLKIGRMITSNREMPVKYCSCTAGQQKLVHQLAIAYDLVQFVYHHLIVVPIDCRHISSCSSCSMQH